MIKDPRELILEPLYYYVLSIGDKTMSNPYSQGNVLNICDGLLTIYRDEDSAKEAAKYYEDERSGMCEIIKVPETIINKFLRDSLPISKDIVQYNITHVIFKVGENINRIEYCENGVDRFRLNQLRLIWQHRLKADKILFVLEEKDNEE